ncbi:MAG: polymer-forming cytoskeletal protein [Polyangiaceae bacterium]|nr:polymer-forming cytoskeletal protein [Polyangiaceae bacterium]
MESGRPTDGTLARPTEITALLGRGTHFEGKLFFEGRVRVDGSFRGEIRGDDVLVIGDGAQIVGDIEVSTCIVTGGQVEGNIRARDAIELYAPSRVTGDLHAPAIFIDRGVVFDGSCKMAPLDGKADEGALERESASPPMDEEPTGWLTETTHDDDRAQS